MSSLDLGLIGNSAIGALRTGEQWRNFVQTYSMVGLVNAAIRLSSRWDEAF